MKMNNRVYGVVGIKSTMANWNADMTGNPKSTSDGEIFGSDKAFKFPIKKMWQANGEKVMYVKSYKISEKKKKKNEEEEESGTKLQPRDLNEQYVNIFGCDLSEKTPSIEVLKNLFSAIDVMNFGATFAEKKQNIGITGVIQVGQGFNKYKGVEILPVDILSPFRSPNEDKEDAQASSIGKKIVTEEAHYFYPFSVNPQNYNVYMELGIPGFEGYTMEAYEKFKKAALIAATAYNTNSKVGCENEFALFVTCKKDSQIYLPCLDTYIQFSKNENKAVIDVSSLAILLKNNADQIENIEVFYNPVTVEVVVGDLSCQIKNLF